MDRPWSRLLRATCALAVGAGLALSAGTAGAKPLPHATNPLPKAATADFQQVTLARGPDAMGEPMAMAILPDGSVLHDSRDGTVYYSQDGVTSVVARLDVYTHDEDGLQGIAIDPQFAQNHWVYMYYAPKLDTPTTDAPEEGTAADFQPYYGYNQLSRFKFTDGKLDLSSEQKILKVGPTNRGMCCHVAGNIDFDGAGNLYLTAGDDSNPFESDGYAPIDRRSTRNPAFDAERSAANTNDLRGKLLRIHVNTNGSYSIPRGNLFPKGTAKTRPEIYAMGFRNPFRFTVDRRTGVVYLADYGPDAQNADPNRGPENTVEFDRIAGPGNFGWPLCIGENTPYRQYDFATGTAGPPFDCAHPKNDSPNNTGLQNLPPAQPAWIANHYAGNPAYPQLGGEGAPMGGPVYHFDKKLDSPAKFPASYDGKFFPYEFGAHWIKPITMDGKGAIQSIETLTDGQDWSQLKEPIDADFGPDGSLYVLDYGSNWFGGSLDAALYKLEYAPGDKSPTANITVDKTSGQSPLTVQFDGTGSTDPENDALTYAWDFDGNGTTDSTEAKPSHTYSGNGQYHAKLTVTDPSGRSGTAAVLVTAGNTAPTITFTEPPNGLTFGDGQQQAWKVQVDDPDGTVDCSKVQVEYSLGHDQHAHNLSQATGCSGTFTLTTAGHTDADNFYGIFSASYTDTSPASGVPDLTSKTQIVLQPKDKQGEFFQSDSGVQVTAVSGAQGSAVTSINDGDWTEYDPYDLQGVSSIGFRVAASGSGGTIEVHADSPTGTLLGSAKVTDTSGAFTTVSAPVTDPGGTHKLFLVFKGGDGDLFTFDAFTMNG
ncbi:PQQ-dependent sugar dehydrogenase [Actinoallomurus iriomotensis]|uniref:Glycosyl hydrolase n=1 Tax=Actinoallomurus iriomotensis TaxID=478107 RepID=A0A9W6RZU2_9ACTN|nr:PQQ-dependent sugar dehydrogenase [Actinoallomurus iriomotensis]GLY85290.1 glycosyl hydrolase [Actinoallomurus iriomotensis]